MKHKLILLSGLPRSGKTTHARGLGYPIVCPDAIRLALHGQRFMVDMEPYVWAIAKTMVKSLFLAGHGFVTLDATNTTQKRRDQWYSGDWDVELVIVNTKMDECLRRAEAEQDWQIIPVIRRMAEETDIENIRVPASRPPAPAAGEAT